MAEWISVEDRLPKWENREDSQSYYVYLENSFWAKHAIWLYVGNGEWYRDDIDRIETDAVTHWMPLLPPPDAISIEVHGTDKFIRIVNGTRSYIIVDDDGTEVEVTQDEFFGNQPADAGLEKG